VQSMTDQSDRTILPALSVLRRAARRCSRESSDTRATFIRRCGGCLYGTRRFTRGLPGGGILDPDHSTRMSERSQKLLWKSILGFCRLWFDRRYRWHCRIVARRPSCQAELLVAFDPHHCAPGLAREVSEGILRYASEVPGWSKVAITTVRGERPRHCSSGLIQQMRAAAQRFCRRLPSSPQIGGGKAY